MNVAVQMNKKVEITKILYTSTCTDTDLTQNKISYSPFLIDLIPVRFFIRDIFLLFSVLLLIEPLLPPARHINTVVCSSPPSTSITRKSDHSIGRARKQEDKCS